MSPVNTAKVCVKPKLTEEHLIILEHFSYMQRRGSIFENENA